MENETLGRVIVTMEDGIQCTLIDVYKLKVEDIDYIIEELKNQKRLMKKWNDEEEILNVT